MQEKSTDAPVPEWDLADRMRKALRHAGLGVQEIAEYLGVARNTVSNWINGRIEPSTQTLRLWALRCGVDYEWLRGAASPHPAVSFPINRVGVTKSPKCAPLRALFGAAA